MQTQTEGDIAAVLPTNKVVTLRRYQNRKLYDPSTHKYVKLSRLVELVGEGRTVKVINNTTQEDITVNVLLNAVAETGKGLENNKVASLLEQLANYLKKGDSHG